MQNKCLASKRIFDADYSIFWKKVIDPTTRKFTFKGQRVGLRSPDDYCVAGKSLSKPAQGALDEITNDQDLENLIVILSGLAYLFYRYQNDQHIIIDTPLLKRGMQQSGKLPAGITEELIFDRVPIIIDMQTIDTVRSLIVQTNEKVVESYQYQNYPLDQFEQLGDSGSLSNVLVNYGDIHLQDTRHDNYDLIINVVRDQYKILRLDISYNQEIYEDWYIENMLSHLDKIYSAFERKTSALNNINIFSSKEERLLKDFSGKSLFKQGITLDIQFNSIVELFPDSTAVVFGDTKVTYNQLDQQSNQLAHYLKNVAGISKRDVVGVCQHKSPMAIVAILSIIKLGACYVPLNSKLPPAALLKILNGDDIPFLVTESQFVIELFDYQGKIIATDIQTDYLNEDTHLNTVNVDIKDLAYIIYTSGSTGQPKGVEVEHGAIASYLAWKRPYYHFDHNTVTLQLASLAFDSSVSDIFSTLLSGGALVLSQDNSWVDIERLAYLIKQHGVTHFAIVPSVYRLLLDYLLEPHELQVITVAGEKVSKSLVDGHNLRLQNVRLVNEYGPSENSICSTVYDFSRQKNSEPFIGRPIDNTQVYLLNKQLQQVPPGCIGEIAVAGSGLARQYRGQEDLTKKQFVFNPNKLEQRLYLTGDLARWHANGNLEYIGRKDGQIKLRGQRIETGHVEAVLLSSAAIREALVIVKEIDQQAELVAYVIHDGEQTVASIRRYLSRHITQALIPAYILLIEKYPLNANGKIDTEKLPDPKMVKARFEKNYQAPSNDHESNICVVWQDKLAVSKLSVEANFFEMGGHSLKAVQIAIELRKMFALKVDVSDIFKFPTVKQLAFELMHRQRVIAESIPKIGELDYYPLSHSQRRIWLLSNNQSSYNLPDAYLIEGVFDNKAFGLAINQMIVRHEILRTVFVFANGGPKQKILPKGNIDIDTIDLRDRFDQGNDHNKANEALELALNAIDDAAKQPFNLQNGPLIRATQLKISASRCIISVTMHHIICDGWSASIFIRELFQLYRHYAVGEKYPLEDLSIQYKDYAAWENTLLDSSAYREDRDYWLEKLKSPLPDIDLPKDYLRLPDPSMEGGCISFYIPRQESFAIRDLNAELGISMHMLLVAVVNILIYRYTGNEDIIVGTPINGRNHPDLEDQLGLYLNTLALRNNVYGSDTVFEVVEKIRLTALGSLEHQQYPFDELVNELGVERDTRRNPLFDVLVSVDELSDQDGMAGLSNEELAVSRLVPDLSESKFDLTFICNNADAELKFDIHYRSELFSRRRIQRMTGHIKRIFTAVLNDLNCPIDKVQILSRRERLALIGDAAPNKTSPDPNTPKIKTYPTLLHQLQEQLQGNPDSLAMVDGSQLISQQVLADKSTRLALLLCQKLGVKRGQIVAILSPAGAQMIIGQLAIMKAGAAYLPLDPELPEQRIKAIVDDSGASLLLVNSDHVNISVEAVAGNIDHFNLAANLHAIMSTIEERPLTLPEPEDLAYVIYTSGSTGKPKGVMIEHRSLLNLTLWYQKHFLITHESRATQYASVSFDASVIETWPYLCCGGSVYPVSSKEKYDVLYFADFCSRHMITHAFLPPVVFDLLCDLSDWEHGNFITFMVGGDKFKGKPHPQWLVYNLYGPTENTVVSSCYKLSKGSDINNVPIGKPIDCCQILILDPSLNLVPIGIDGEMYLSGLGVARGYCHDAAQTNAYFINHPFKDGGRLYKTGDIARWNDQGEVELLGRKDHQISIRGFRVETAEIECAALAFPLVRQSAVVTNYKKGKGGDELVLKLFLVVAQKQSFDAGQLLLFLKTTLPRYMLPHSITVLDKFPLTENGKLDYDSLKAVAVQCTTEDFQPPETETERALAIIWGNQLDVDQIGRLDNFFALGGNSLSAMKVMFTISEVFSADMNVWDMFQASTLQEMAILIANSTRATNLANSTVGNARDTIPLSLLQEHLWKIHQALDFYSHGTRLLNMSLEVQITGNLDIELLQRSVEEMVQCHDILKTTFSEIDSDVVQVIDPALKGDFVIADVSCGKKSEAGKAHNKKVEKNARELAGEEFDLETAPLVRFLLIQRAQCEYRLLITMHHIIGDARSLNEILFELFAFYQLRQQGMGSEDNVALKSSNQQHSANLAGKNSVGQYSDYARWQRECIKNNAFDTDYRYWENLLEQSYNVSSFPWHKNTFIDVGLETGAYAFNFSFELSNRIKAYAQENNVTVFIVLMTAYKILLAKYTVSENIRVATNIDTRNRVELENTIGPFINTGIIHTNLPQDIDYQRAIQLTRDSFIEAYSHSNLPIETALEYLKELGLENVTQFCQYMFVFQDAVPHTFEIEALDISFLQDLDGVGEGGVEDTNSDFTPTSFDLVLNIKAGNRGYGGSDMGKSDEGTENERSMSGIFIYKADLFPASKVVELGLGLTAILESLCNNDVLNLSEIQLGELD